MDKVYRIYTEDLARDVVLNLIMAKFESFTLQPTTGYFKGKAEQSIVIEIVDARQEDVEMLAHNIGDINGQKSVLVMSLTGQAKKIK
jgi:hypothetical protein